LQSRYLVDAAELLLGPDDDLRLGERGGRRTRAATLLEKALEAEADSIPAAGRLATILLDDRQGERLVVTFRDALLRAKAPDAIVMLGSEIARVARDELKDLTIAIDAMRRVRDMAPQHVPSLLTLAELCIAQRAWPEAVEALEAVVTTSHEVAPRLTALFALASVYEKVLSRPDDVERVLRAALALDPQNPRALKALLRRITSANAGAKEGAMRDVKPEELDEVEDLLARLCDVEKVPEQKSSLLLELAEVRIRVADKSPADAGAILRRAELALVDAVAYSPLNARAFARLSSFFKMGAARDHVGYARALTGVIAQGQKIGQVDPRWLAALGQLEVESLSRMREGIAHLLQATQMDPNLYETRYELAHAYARVSANDEAARVLYAMLSPSPRPLLSIADPASALELLERALGAERRAEEAIVVSELRAIAGELDDGRHAWLRARRLGPIEQHHALLDRPTLVTHVLPPEGRHILLEVAAAVAGIEAKILRADLSELGISSRDRVSSRSGHPTRLLLDRLLRQLGLADIELVISSNVARTRVLAQDVPWVVVPRALTELPEPAQLASLGRSVARIAFGVPWAEELAPPHIEALLVAAARQVVPGFAADDVDVLAAKLVAQYETQVAKALSRRQKKLLEELAPHIGAPAGRIMPADAFVGCLARAEMRTAYLLGGDLLASIDELRAMDSALHRATDAPGPGALAAVLEHAFAGDVVRFALTNEATALRRRVGASWAG
jgi:tetratricopeptide (TPR) repeat protein